MDGGSYTIAVEVGENELVVVEPNKRSVYRRVGATKEYRFFNANTGSTFALTVVDDRTLRASRVPETIAPNILRLVGASTALAAASETDRFKAIAERYRLLAEGDTDNTQVWTFCAAAAMGWAMRPEAEAAAYAWRAAQQVKPIAVDPARTPCPDVIPPALWASASAPSEGSPLARAPQPAGRAARAATAPPAAVTAQSAPTPAAPTAASTPAARPESQATAALRDRAERTAATAAAANDAVRADDAQFAAALGAIAGAQVDGAASSVLATGAVNQASARAELASLIPTPGQVGNVWRDFRARRAAIDAQNEYIAQLRRDRLAAGVPDVQGFKVPVRPSPTDIVDRAQNARITGLGIVPQLDPSLRAYVLQQLNKVGAASGDSSLYIASSGLGLVHVQGERLQGFSERLVSNAVSLQFTLESSDGKLQPYQQLRCVLYGPDGETMKAFNAMGVNTRRRVQEKQEFNEFIAARSWRPGTYGIECGPLFSNAPWFNLTFDVMP
jgi:hypothetical protein